jgi:hypothetical protein
MTDKLNALATAEPKNPAFKTGKNFRKVDSKFALTSANSDAGDILELAGALSFADRVAGLYANVSTGLPALTSATDNDLGFYYKNSEGEYVELDKDILWDGVSLASASTTNGNYLTGKNASLDESQNIGELLGLGADKQPQGGVFLCLTVNTANTATATLRLSVEIDEATTS